jgi:hypothetical protein
MHGRVSRGRCGWRCRLRRGAGMGGRYVRVYCCGCCCDGIWTVSTWSCSSSPLSPRSINYNTGAPAGPQLKLFSESGTEHPPAKSAAHLRTGSNLIAPPRLSSGGAMADSGRSSKVGRLVASGRRALAAAAAEAIPHRQVLRHLALSDPTY